MTLSTMIGQALCGSGITESSPHNYLRRKGLLLSQCYRWANRLRQVQEIAHMSHAASDGEKFDPPACLQLHTPSQHPYFNPRGKRSTSLPLPHDKAQGSICILSEWPFLHILTTSSLNMYSLVFLLCDNVFPTTVFTHGDNPNVH